MKNFERVQLVGKVENLPDGRLGLNDLLYHIAGHDTS